LSRVPGWCFAGLAGLLVCLSHATFAASLPAQSGSGSTAKEVRVADDAFERAAPLPPWSQPLSDVPDTQRDAPVVTRLSESQFYAAARPAYLVHSVRQVNDVSSLAVVGQIALEFIPEYQKLRLHKLVVLRGHQQIDHTQDVDIRFLQREAGLEAGLYSGAVTATLLLDDIRVGDAVEIVYSIEGANPVFGGKYMHSASWDLAMPTELRRVWLMVPTTRTVHWKMLGDYRATDVKPEMTERNGMRIWKFEARKLEPIDPESYTPLDFVPYRFIQFSEFDDWAGVAQWATGLFPPVTSLPEEAKGLITQWRRLPTQEAQAVAALHWVQNEIRYFSVSMGESSHRPSPPQDVFQRRFGDCKDKTYLLVTLLKAMGIEARPMFIDSSSPRMPNKYLPSALDFDHVVVEAHVDGKTRYLDGTRLGQDGQLDSMGSVFPGAYGLAVDKNTTALTHLENDKVIQLSTVDLSESIVVKRLAEDADGELTTTQTWRGSAAEYMRLQVARLSPDQRRKMVTATYEDRYVGIDLLDDPVYKDDVQNNVFTRTSHFKVPKLLTLRSGAWVLRYFPTNMSGVFNLPKVLKRNFPLEATTVPYVANYRLDIQWPSDVSAQRDPLSQHLDNAYFKLATTQSFRGDHTAIEARLETVAEQIPASEPPALATEMKKIADILPGQFVLAASEARQGGTSATAKMATALQNLQLKTTRQIERTTKVLASGVLQGEDRAQVLCQRADAYYDSGKVTEGMADAEEAVQIAPSLGRAYLCRGDLQMLAGAYSKAEADYTAALGLGADVANTYYARGRARFFAGKLDTAIADFVKARQAASDDALYPALWEAIASLRSGHALSDKLVKLSTQQPTGSWPRPALAMLQGALTPEQMLAEVNRKHGDELQLTLVEARFYLGELYLAQGRSREARALFQQVLDSGIRNYNEYLASTIELGSVVHAAE